MERQAIKTFNQLATSYMADYEKKGHSPVTVNANRQYLQVNVCSQIGRRQVGRVSTEDAEAVLEFMRGKELSERTIMTVYGLARRVGAYGVELGLMKDNPFALVDPGIHEKQEAVWFSEEDVQRMRKAFSAHRFGNLFGLVLTGGISRSEVLGLKWSDADLTEGTLTIRRLFIDELGNLILRPCKREKQIRLSREALQYLLQEKGAQQARRAAAGEKWQDAEDLVFTDDAGYPIRPDRISFEMTELNKELRIAGLNLRNLKTAYEKRLGL